MEMYDKSIFLVVEELSKDKNVIGILITGSYAHGYANDKSDLDLVIILKELEYEKRKLTNSLKLDPSIFDSITDMKLDGKYTSIRTLKKILNKSSEASRYVYKDAIVLYAINDSIKELVRKVSVYPSEHRDQRMLRFFAQIYAWRSFFYEANHDMNTYLLHYSISNFILFTARLILAHNEMLYPSHKWLVNELNKAEHKPEGIVELITRLLEVRDSETLELIYIKVKDYYQLEVDETELISHYRDDIELMWIQQEPSIYEI